MIDKLIYIADMDINVKEYVKKHLEANGYRTGFFDNGEKLTLECNVVKPDFIILDIKLQGIDGLEVCRILRQGSYTRDIPILFLTDKKEDFDVALGLEIGADDYMTKPFSVRELQSRIKAVLRRTQRIIPNETDIMELNNLKIDLQGRIVYKGNISIKFPMKEFELLTLLVLNMGKVLSREYLLEQIWGADYYSGSRTMDVHIRYIRRKLEDLDSEHSYIESIRRVGYRFNDKKLNKMVI